MKSNKNYVTKTYTTPEELFDRFVQHCKENNLNRSAVIRDLLTKYLNAKKNK